MSSTDKSTVRPTRLKHPEEEYLPTPDHPEACDNPKCRRIKAPKRTRCRHHLTANRESTRRRNAECVENDVCKMCRNVVTEPRKLCEGCRQYLKVRYDSMKERGSCVRCRATVEDPKFTSCAKCRHKRKIYRRKRNKTHGVKSKSADPNTRAVLDSLRRSLDQDEGRGVRRAPRKEQKDKNKRKTSWETVTGNSYP